MSNESSYSGIVVYTDGGACKGNPGFGGSGVYAYHYTYSPDTPKELITGNASTWGYSDQTDEKVSIGDTFERCAWFDEKITNNYAELYAGILGMELALEVHLINPVKRVCVLSDSTYFIRWAGAAIKDLRDSGKSPLVMNDRTPNHILWNRVFALITMIHGKGIRLNFKWVKGHNGDFGNETADRLATIGTERSELTIREGISFAKDGYPVGSKREDIPSGNKISEEEKVNIEEQQKIYNADIDQFEDLKWLFDVRYIFFASPFPKDNEELFLCSLPRTYDKERFRLDCGGKSAGTAYRLLHIPGGINYLNKFRNLSFGKTPDDVVLCTMDVSNLAKASTKEAYRQKGESTFVIDSNGLDVVSPLGENLGYINSPVRSSYVVFSNFDSLYPLFMDAQGERKLAEYCCVTDQFFKIEETKKGHKKVVHPDMVQTDTAWPVTVNYTLPGQPDKNKLVTVRVDLRQDCISRNGLKKMEKYDPEVYLVIADCHDDYFKYFVYIELNNGIRGFWASVDTNIKIVT